MSSSKTIRGTAVDSDVVAIATDDDGLDTAVVGFFDANFPRGTSDANDRLGDKARSRHHERATTPPALLRK